MLRRGDGPGFCLTRLENRMGPARRVKLRFGIVSRRWGFRRWGFPGRRPRFWRRVPPLTVDRDVLDENGEPAVVGTYRLLRGEVAAVHGGYYTSAEYDLTPMLKSNAPGTRYLELGRSCVLKSYRAKAITMQLLWRGIIVYLDRYAVDVMFGCGSLPGTDPDALKLPLSYLHHFHSTPA